MRLVEGAEVVSKVIPKSAQTWHNSHLALLSSDRDKGVPYYFIIPSNGGQWTQGRGRKHT